MSAALVLAGLVGGCATRPATTPAASTTTTSSPSTSTTQPGQQVNLTDQADHTTVRVRTGQVVQVGLRSTYWSDPVSTPAGILVAEGPVARAPGHGCPIGSGCGVVSVGFRAAATGTAQIESTRSSCGEAMQCAPGQRQFTVTVVVTGN